MEHISKALESLSTEPAIPSLKIYEEPEPKELTLEEKREEFRIACGISSLDNTFENFDKVKGTYKPFSAFKSLASGKTHWKMLLCCGGTGNGKTHLCEALVIELYKRGIRSHIETMAIMMGRIKQGMKPDARVTSEEQIARYRKVERLILDDVGMGGSGSEWEWGQLEDIIAYRYRENLFTVLTSNLDLKQIIEKSERIVSRFRDAEKGRIVINEAPDYRPFKGKK